MYNGFVPASAIESSSFRTTGTINRWCLEILHVNVLHRSLTCRLCELFLHKVYAHGRHCRYCRRFRTRGASRHLQRCNPPLWRSPSASDWQVSHDTRCVPCATLYSYNTPCLLQQSQGDQMRVAAEFSFFPFFSKPFYQTETQRQSTQRPSRWQ